MQTDVLPTLDREALLAQALKKPAGKSNTPAVAVPEATAAALRRLVELKRAKKDLEAEEGLLQADHFPVLDALRCRTSQDLHKYLSSIKAAGVTFCAVRNQGKTPLEKLPELDLAFGAARKDYLPVRTSIEIDEAKVPDALLVDLVAAGAVIKRHVEITEKLVQDAALLPEVALKAKQAGLKLVNLSVKE